MMKMPSYLARSFNLALIIYIGIFSSIPTGSQAKGDDDQDQIILLNDSAAALEDSDLKLSKELAKLADEKEKEWEDKNANKEELPAPITDKNIKQFQDQIDLLKAASLAIKPTYPLIAAGLNKMAKEINRKIENEN